MPPVDPTPLGDEMVHRLPERKFPQPKPRAGTETDESAPDIARRPSLPDHPEQMAADIEDEEADPVVDSGPGITDGVHSLNRQKG